MGTVPRIVKGFFIKMSVKFKYYYITTYIKTLSRIYVVYIVVYSEYNAACFIFVYWNIISTYIGKFFSDVKYSE